MHQGAHYVMPILPVPFTPLKPKLQKPQPDNSLEENIIW